MMVLRISYVLLVCGDLCPRCTLRLTVYYAVPAISRNYEKGFPPQLSDCYIRVVYNYLTALLEYLDLFTIIIIQNNAISVAIM